MRRFQPALKSDNPKCMNDEEDVQTVIAVPSARPRVPGGAWSGLHHGERGQRSGRDPDVFAGWGKVRIPPAVDAGPDDHRADRGAGDGGPYGRGHGQRAVGPDPRRVWTAGNVLHAAAAWTGGLVGRTQR